MKAYLQPLVCVCLACAAALCGATNQPDRVLAAAQAARDEQVLRDATVKGALARARAQVAESALLQRYAITSNDVERIVSREAYTKVQRDRAFQDLWSRAKPDPADSATRFLFLPFPSGLKYAVEDVEQEPSGRYAISLISLEKRNWQTKDQAGAYPDHTLEAIENALLPGLVDLKQLRIITSPNAKGAEKYRKRQILESGKWVIPVMVKSGGYILVNSPIRIYVQNLENPQEAPVIYGPGKLVQEQPGSADSQDGENIVTIDVCLLRPITPDAETGQFLSDWYLDYRRGTEAADQQKKLTKDDWIGLYQRYMAVEGLMAAGSKAPAGRMPGWSQVWEVEVQGERHLLLTGSTLTPSREPRAMRVLMVRAFEEFNDEKGFQRTPLVLAQLPEPAP
jgi:hypothetical protein